MLCQQRKIEYVKKLSKEQCPIVSDVKRSDGAGGAILQRKIAIVLKGESGFRCDIAMTSRVTCVSSKGHAGQRRSRAEGTSVSAQRGLSAEGSSGGVRHDNITYAAATFSFRREFFCRTRTARNHSLARNESLRRKAS